MLQSLSSACILSGFLTLYYYYHRRKVYIDFKNLNLETSKDKYPISMVDM